MSTRAVLVVGLAAVVVLAGVGPVAGVVAPPVEDRTAPPDYGDATPPTGHGDASVSAASPTAENATVGRTGDALAQYKVSLNNVTIRTWLLRNSTVRNATVEEVVVRNATTPDGARTDVTLTNVTVGTFVMDRAKLTNVTARQLVVRNRSVLSVPGGEFIDPNVNNRTIERHWTRNATVAGVVIDRIAIDAAVLCENASLGQQAEDAESFDPQTGEEEPDVTVQNGSVEQALVIHGQASDWSVGSIDQSDAENATLPQGCNRG